MKKTSLRLKSGNVGLVSNPSIFYAIHCRIGTVRYRYLFPFPKWLQSKGKVRRTYWISSSFCVLMARSSFSCLSAIVFSALRLFKLSFKVSRALSCKRILCIYSICEPVFRIRDILVRIRMRILGSMPLTYGPGCGSGPVRRSSVTFRKQKYLFFIYILCFNKWNLKLSK